VTHQGLPAAVIAAEIRALRKGCGALASDLRRRLGPCLRELATGGGDLRLPLAGELARLAGSLPVDLQLAVLASLGLEDQTGRCCCLRTGLGVWLTNPAIPPHRPAPHQRCGAAADRGGHA